MADVYRLKVAVLTEKGEGILFGIEKGEAVVEFDHSYLVGFDPEKVMLKDNPDIDLFEWAFHEQWI